MIKLHKWAADNFRWIPLSSLTADQKNLFWERMPSDRVKKIAVDEGDCVDCISLEDYDQLVKKTGASDSFEDAMEYDF